MKTSYTSLSNFKVSDNKDLQLTASNMDGQNFFIQS